MAIELMTATRRKLLLLTAMCLLAVSVMGAANVTTELVAQPSEKKALITYLSTLSESLAFETESADREAWVDIAREKPVAFLKACTGSDQ